MATLQFKPDELLKKMRIKKYAADQLISEGKGGSPNTPTPDWDKNWPKPGTAPKPEDRPNIPTKLASRDGLMIASGDADPSTMNYVTVGGFFLDGSGKAYMQTEGKLYDAGEYNPDIHGLPVPLAKNKAQNGMKIAGKKDKDQNLAWLRASGSGAMSNKEFKDGLRIINTTSPNESIRNQRELLLIRQAAGGV